MKQNKYFLPILIATSLATPIASAQVLGGNIGVGGGAGVQSGPVNVGGAVRWQDKAAIGYYPKYNSEAGIWVTDVTKPIYAPSETNYDAWVGYERKLSKGITWIVQLNVYDAFAKNDLIPIAANPDGTTAQVRIPSETTWALTNTIRF